MSHTFRIGGIHPPESKLTAGSPIIDVELPCRVVIPFGQHIGAPASCCVAKGDVVMRGQVVAAAAGFVSANIHTPISGTVAKIDRIKNPQGMPVDAIVIEASEEQHAADIVSLKNRKPLRDEGTVKALSPKEIVEIVDEAGIVGLGGATFPTKVKLSPPPGCKAEVLIVNGVECEPYLTNDHAIMLEHADEIINGIRLLMRAAGVDRAIIGIEVNKPDAIERMSKATARCPGIEVMPLKVKYPQGSEKQLIEATIGREVPSGGLPIAVGAIVQNVATALAVNDAVVYGLPLMSRVVTITGPYLKNAGNYRVALGTDIHSLLDVAGYVPGTTGKVILGGPMMGKTAVNIDTPITKGVSGILLIPEMESRRPKPEPCIRCGACVDACCMGLEPYLLSTLARHGRWEQLETEKVMNCVECGSCSFTCPAARPLLDYIRLGKNKVGAIIRARKS